MKTTIVLALLLLSSVYCIDCDYDQQLRNGQCENCPVGKKALKGQDCQGCNPGGTMTRTGDNLKCNACGGTCFDCPGTVDANTKVCQCPPGQILKNEFSTYTCYQETAEEKAKKEEEAKKKEQEQEQQQNNQKTFSSILLSGFGLILSVFLF